MYNLNEFSLDFAKEFKSVGSDLTVLANIVEEYDSLLDKKQLHNECVSKWKNNKQVISKEAPYLLSDEYCITELTREINRKSKDVCEAYRYSNIVYKTKYFYNVLYLSFFLGVAKYFDDIKGGLTKTQRKAVRMLHSDAHKVQKLIVKTQDEIEKVNLTGHMYSVKLDNIIEDFNNNILVKVGLDKYNYLGEKISILNKLLKKRGINISDISPYTKGSFFGLWYEHTDYVLGDKNARRNNMIGYLGGAEFGMVDKVDCFVREIRKLGDSYICWPLIGCHYNLVYRFIPNRTKYIDEREKKLKNSFNEVQKRLINSKQTISKISDYLGR